MVTEDDTRVIDPKFSCYGPMGFDVGLPEATGIVQENKTAELPS